MNISFKKVCTLILIFTFVMGLVCVRHIENIEAATPDCVIVLDAGHDASHSGAHQNGYAEEYLNLRIAQYCKMELERINGVKVYMIRDGEACPYGGSSIGNNTVCNSRRVSFAKNVKADYYVSFHLDSSGSSARGASVYYPNNNYRPEIGNNGRQLASSILSQLKAVGVSQRGSGIMIRNSEAGETYPDGSAADYLAVIKGNKKNNITPVLIEHCFISNRTDCNNFLSSDGKLHMLGRADAIGILNHIGLNNTAVNKAADGNWYYYRDGNIDYGYTGLAVNNNGWWYVKNGKVDFSATTVVKYRNVWWYVKGGKYDPSYSGLAHNQNGDWCVKNGEVDFGCNGLVKIDGKWRYFKNGQVDYNSETVVKNSNGWWYVHNGEVDFSSNTVAKNENGWWYIKDGKVDFGFNGIARNKNGDWFISGGKVDFAKTAIIDVANITQKLNYSTGETVKFDGSYYIENGRVLHSATIVGKRNNTWVYMENGRIIPDYKGVGSNSNGIWFIEDGEVRFNYNGTVIDKNGFVYVFSGSKNTISSDGPKTIDNEVLDLRWDTTDYLNGQYLFENGKADVNRSGVVKCNKIWWHIKDGAVLTDSNTVAKNSNGWWYIKDGKVDFGYTGVARNENGDWYLKDGKVQMDAKGLIKVKYNKQYYPNSNYDPVEFEGWYNFNSGKIAYKQDVVKNENGWWYVGDNGKVDFGYNGLAQNSNGLWYIQGGKVDFSYNTTNFEYDGKYYNIIGGKATEVKAVNDDIKQEQGIYSDEIMNSDIMGVSDVDEEQSELITDELEDCDLAE